VAHPGPPPLSPETSAAIEQIGGVDLAVGIPSFNNADTIGHVVRALQVGLLKYFPDQRAVLINADGGSTDGTRAIVEKAVLQDPTRLFVGVAHAPTPRIVTEYHGLPGKGSAFRTIFHVARRLGARACCVVDSDLRSITPEWVESLLRPVIDDSFDFVAPLYLRHKYDGTITNSIVYPLTRALYGVNLRQPIGGDFGFSDRLADLWLSRDVWESEVARFGIDIWMTTTAVAEGYRCCESFLGAKIHNPKDPGADLAAMLTQVTGSVFRLLEEYESVWWRDPLDASVPLFGFRHDVGLEPVHVNLPRMSGAFHAGLRDLAPLWSQALSESTWRELQLLDRPPDIPPDFHDSLWVRVVYDFAAANHSKRFHRDTLLRALTPLYLGRVASFVAETVDASAVEVEQRLDALCRVFREERPYLRARWNPARAAEEVSS
jgi:glycosyltransferase involved in cell wall biosynthesis